MSQLDATLRVLSDAASASQPCPTDREIGAALGLGDEWVRREIRALRFRGDITIDKPTRKTRTIRIMKDGTTTLPGEAVRRRPKNPPKPVAKVPVSFLSPAPAPFSKSAAVPDDGFIKPVTKAQLMGSGRGVMGRI